MTRKILPGDKSGDAFPGQQTRLGRLSGVMNLTGTLLRGDESDWDYLPGRQIRGHLSGTINLTGTLLREEKSDWDLSPVKNLNLSKNLQSPEPSNSFHFRLELCVHRMLAFDTRC